MLRHWREREFSRRLAPAGQRSGLAAWRYLNRWPWLYRRVTSLVAGLLYRLSVPDADGRRWLRRLPWFGSAWTRYRDMPAPGGETFQARWRRARK